MKPWHVVASALIALVCTSAHADTGKPPLVVLDLEAKGATALQAEAATQGVVRGIRDLDVFQVLSSQDVRQLLALERTRALVGVGNEGGADFARLLGAQSVVVGTVTVVGSGMSVEIRLLDTAKRQVIAQKTLGPLKGIEELAAKIPALSQELISPILQEQQGALLVECKEEAAEILIDDTLVGTTPLKTPLKLARGSHRLMVRKDGFIAQGRTVRILPEQVTVETFTLLPSPDYAEAYRNRYGRLRVGAMIATGAAVVALGSAVAVDRLITQPTFEKDFYPRQLALSQVPESQLPSTVSQNAANLDTYRTCGLNAQLCATDMSRLQGQLQTQQVITIGLIGVGAVAAGAATYLWITGQDPNRYANLVATVSFGDGAGFVVSGRF